MSIEQDQSSLKSITKKQYHWIWDVLLLAILVLGGYFRLVGLNWDSNHHLHPDERFLTMVETSISPVQAGDYFDTDHSTLNPHNTGYSFYVYGTLPLFIVRYVGEWIGKTGYDEIFLVGRFLSALFDLFTVFVVYLIAFRLYKRPGVAVLAAGFSAFAVLQIQLSHFFTVDSFLTFFITLMLYFAIQVMTPEIRLSTDGDPFDRREIPSIKTWLKLPWRNFAPYALFGVSLGMAVACKVSAAPVAILLPVGAAIYYFQLPESKRGEYLIVILRNLILAAVISLIVFRVFQPYAFSGPGFFGIQPNPKWIANLKELQNQSTGNVDFPPALQWARRPLWFGWWNMTAWGLGLPLGLLSWAGFLWMGWKIWKRHEWAVHLLIWLWVGLFFLWQGTGFVSSMRYLLPIYPAMAVIAAWGIHSLWITALEIKKPKIDVALCITSIVIGVGVLIASGMWSYAFTRIYTRPEARVAASSWIYENIPGPINLQIIDAKGIVQQPLSTLGVTTLSTSQPLRMTFSTDEVLTITQLDFENFMEIGSNGEQRTVVVTIKPMEQKVAGEVYGYLLANFDAPQPYSIPLQTPMITEPGLEYEIKLEVLEPALMRLTGKIKLNGINSEGNEIIYSLPELVEVVRQDKPYTISTVIPVTSGELSSVGIPHAVDWWHGHGNKILQLSVSESGNPGTILGKAIVQSDFGIASDDRGNLIEFQLEPTILLDSNKQYTFTFELIEGEGAIAFYGSRVAVESTWDLAIPLDLGRGNPFDTYSGIYRTDLNFEMYWDDSLDKKDRFQNILDQTDYIIMSSNRQWGTTVRVPERYPLTTFVYRHLVGCPDGMDTVKCYNLAEPGMYTGDLGFELVNVTTSYPNLGKLEFNTQFAEEAFTVYDHPKVMIFKKTDGYHSATIQAKLDSVDLSKVIHLTPREASKYRSSVLSTTGGQIGPGPATLTLPENQLEEQQSGGTWNDLFDINSMINRHPGLGLIVWYLAITVLGWIVYPLLRVAMKGLADRGYTFAKLSGLIILAFMVWLAASVGLTFSKLTISIALLIILAVSLIVTIIHWREIVDEFRTRWKYFVIIEIASILFLGSFLLVRLGNPDLWHPFKGGEKPMDFAYFNAILKSTSFPPYDPWFSGGYINYYYYGFVIVGVLVKWLGIVPSIAYNLILPTWFSFEAMGAFGIAISIYSSVTRKNSIWLKNESTQEEKGKKDRSWIQDWTLIWVGLAGAVCVLILGNLGTVRMIWYGLQRLVAPGGIIEGANFLQRMEWTIGGLGQYFSGVKFPYGWGEWYWIPSRALPGDTITEFPAFTFLYADMHAHLIALPITILAIAWAFSILMERGSFLQNGKWLSWIWTISFGAIVIGALRPTNTWDFPTYLGLAVVTLLYTGIRYYLVEKEQSEMKVRRNWRTTLLLLGSLGLFIALALLFYAPFSHWYGQGYTSIRLWEGEHSPFWSYITHWGLFLFIIVTWLIHEMVDWLANTPFSALSKLRLYKNYILVFTILIFGVVVFLQAGGTNLLLPENLRFELKYPGIQIAWLAVFIILLSFVLILRPNQPDGKRFTLFLITLATTLTLVVEVVVLQGDIGRMNTVFKFYLQGWTMLGISAAVCLFWLIPHIRIKWKMGLQSTWMTIFVLLIGSAALFPYLATVDKIRDRMDIEAPHTLDGMMYMATSHYNEAGYDLDLNEDYLAIKWMQQNINGSPVIVEGNAPLYHWGSRFSIYTGLPTVIGWDWHQIQQRALTPSTWVTDRIKEVSNFYSTTDKSFVAGFLQKYDVSYVIVGQLEQVLYPGEGMGKFQNWEGDLWDRVYQDKATTIYQVKK